jgi:hypothetical protein
MRRAFSAAALLLLLPISIMAGSAISQVRVTNLAINKTYGNLVFIQVNGTPSGAPACSSGTWQYTLSLGTPSDKELYAMLLMVYSTGAVVNITGTGACSDVNFVESLQGLQATQ